MSAINCDCVERSHSNPRLVVITGGPGAGKTAVLELARRRFCEHVSILPEAATIIFSGGFPRLQSERGRMAAQRAIFHVQQELERQTIEEGKSSLILCDRGTVDGFAYWPHRQISYWDEVGTTREAELARYATVIHLRTPTNERGYGHSNPMRIESAEQAAEIDDRLLGAWRGHPHQIIIESSEDFLAKAKKAIDLIESLVPECCRKKATS